MRRGGGKRGNGRGERDIRVMQALARMFPALIVVWRPLYSVFQTWHPSLGGAGPSEIKIS